MKYTIYIVYVMILIALAVSVSATTEEDIVDRTIFYYQMNQPNGSLVPDAVNNFNGTVHKFLFNGTEIDPPNRTGGKLNSGMPFKSAIVSSHVTILSDCNDTCSFTDSFMTCLWTNISDFQPNRMEMVTKADNDGNISWGLGHIEAGSLNFTIFDTSNVETSVSAIVGVFSAIGDFKLVCGGWDSIDNEIYIYENNTKLDSVTFTGVPRTNTFPVRMGARQSGFDNFPADLNSEYIGSMDEIIIINMSGITDEQTFVDFLYNNNIGRELFINFAPIITNQQENNSNPVTSDDVFFNATVTDDIEVDSCSLFHNNSGSFVNQGLATNISSEYRFTETDTWLSGSVGWFFSCKDIFNRTTNGTTQSLNVPFGNLNIVFTDPLQDDNHSFGFFKDYSFQVTCSGGDCGNVNITLDPIPFEQNLLLGLNSVIADVLVNEDNPDFNFNGAGQNTILQIGEIGANQKLETYIRWNISTIPADVEILNATMILFLIFNNAENPDTYDVFEVQNITWNPSVITFNNKPTFQSLISQTLNDNITGDFVIVNKPFPLDVTSWLKLQYDLNASEVSFFIDKSDDLGSGDDNVRFSASEGSNTPLLNITFSIGFEKGIIPVGNGTPFFTITQNPSSICGNMLNGDVCNITFEVNATGNVSDGYVFFATADSFNLNILQATTELLVITIIDVVNPVVTNQNQNNTLPTVTDDIIFNATVTDDFQVLSCNLYHDNNGSFVNQGLATNISSTFSFVETDTWNDEGNLVSWFFNCSDTSGNIGLGAVQTFNINSRPNITFIRVDKIDGFTLLTGENISIEYRDGIFTWITQVTDINSNLLNITYTFFNRSGNIISQEFSLTPIDVETISGLFVNFVQENPFNFTILARDTSGEFRESSIVFNVTDTIFPLCIGLEDSEIIENTTFTWAVTCNDENFFSFDISCNNPAQFNFSVEGLDVTEFNFSGSTSIEGQTSCSFEFCDGHTAKKIKEMVIKVNNNTNTMTFDGKISISSDVNLKEMKFKYKTDRYTIEIKTSIPVDEIEFNITSDEYIHIMPSDTYIGWLVTGDYWLDFDNKKVILARITRVSDTEVKVKLTFDTKVSKIVFNSIGKLNCVTGTQSISVRPHPLGVFRDRVCPLEKDLPFVIGFFAIVIFLIGMIVMNEMFFRIPIFNFVSGFGFIIISFAISPCSLLLSVPFFVFGIMLGWVEIARGFGRPAGV